MQNGSPRVLPILLFVQLDFPNSSIIKGFFINSYHLLGLHYKPLRNMISVSYTHLDVYKRQVVYMYIQYNMCICVYIYEGDLKITRIFKYKQFYLFLQVNKLIFFKVLSI